MAEMQWRARGHMVTALPCGVAAPGASGLSPQRETHRSASTRGRVGRSWAERGDRPVG
jgi:hypothetical protein